jgi:hypothetical protein
VPISLALALAQMYIYISTFRSMPYMGIFCSSLTSWFPGIMIIIIIIIISSLLAVQLLLLVLLLQALLLLVVL